MDQSWVRHDATFVDRRDEARKVMAWLRGETKKRPIVMDRHKPIGVINARPMMGRRVDGRMHIDKLAQPVPVMDRTSTDEEIFAAFSDTLAPYLPVRDGGRYPKPSYIDAMAVLHAYPDGPTAGAAMQADTALRPDDSLGQAAHVFAKTAARHLPVNNADGTIAGMLDRAAVLRRQPDGDSMRRGDHGGGSGHGSSMAGTVADVMDTNWQHLTPETPYKQVVDCLHWYGYAFITGPDERYQGTVSPALMVRALGKA